MSKLWLSNATRMKEPNNGAFTGGPMKGLLHSTEVPFGAGWATYNFLTKPNLEVIGIKATKSVRWRQFYPFDQPGRSLVDSAGAVRTNRDGVIQVEMGFQAVHADDLPDWFWAGVATGLREIEDKCGINPAHWAKFVAYRANPPSSYGANNGVRFSAKEWDGFDGWCGHMHAPENVHGDPGDIPVADLKRPTTRKYHIIKPGENVRAIAAAFDISVTRLWRLNQPFKPGQKIRVR